MMPLWSCACMDWCISWARLLAGCLDGRVCGGTKQAGPSAPSVLRQHSVSAQLSVRLMRCPPSGPLPPLPPSPLFRCALRRCLPSPSLAACLTATWPLPRPHPTCPTPSLSPCQRLTLSLLPPAALPLPAPLPPPSPPRLPRCLPPTPTSSACVTSPQGRPRTRWRGTQVRGGGRGGGRSSAGKL